MRERFRRGSFFNAAFLSIWGSVLNFSSSGHVAAGFSAVPSILAAFLTVVLPAAPPKPRVATGSVNMRLAYGPFLRSTGYVGSRTCLGLEFPLPLTM